MIGTGGTIASEMTPEGLTPELNTHQLLAYLPRIAQLCHVDCIQLYSLDSTSIHPTHWLGTAQAIREHYDDYDGFVISHGTDTMAYTAAALSYLVQDSPKPIILTGAQKPIWFDGTDSKRNLTDAFLYAWPGLRRRADRLNGGSFWGPVPARPTPRVSGPSPASITPIWRWCRTSICYSTSVVRAGHGRYFMTAWTPMWGC